MDKLVSKIAALGIPGLVLVTAIGATGLAGGAAITTALAALGPHLYPSKQYELAEKLSEDRIRASEKINLTGDDENV